MEERGLSSEGRSWICLAGAEGRVLRRERIDFEVREERIVVAWSFRWDFRVATVVVRWFWERGEDVYFGIGGLRFLSRIVSLLDLRGETNLGLPL